MHTLRLVSLLSVFKGHLSSYNHVSEAVCLSKPKITVTDGSYFSLFQADFFVEEIVSHSPEVLKKLQCVCFLAG